MKKKPWIVVLFALLVIAAVSFTLSSGSAKDAVPQTGNLIANGDFSILEDGQPKGWETGMWVTSAGASYLESVTLADGTTAALVENAASNDARFEQAVAVRERHLQHLPHVPLPLILLRHAHQPDVNVRLFLLVVAIIQACPGALHQPRKPAQFPEGHRLKHAFEQWEKRRQLHPFARQAIGNERFAALTGGVEQSGGEHRADKTADIQRCFVRRRTCRPHSGFLAVIVVAKGMADGLNGCFIEGC